MENEQVLQSVKIILDIWEKMSKTSFVNFLVNLFKTNKKKI